MDGYRKLHKFTNVISYFSLQSWKFHDNNTKSLVKKLSKVDRELFKFDVAKLDWNEYFLSYVIGIRVFIFKDPLETLPEAEKHYKR